MYTFFFVYLDVLLGIVLNWFYGFVLILFSDFLVSHVQTITGSTYQFFKKYAVNYFSAVFDFQPMPARSAKHEKSQDQINCEESVTISFSTK